MPECDHCGRLVHVEDGSGWWVDERQSDQCPEGDYHRVEGETRFL